MNFLRVSEAPPPLPPSAPSAVSESSWASATPVEMSCWRTASAMGITMAVVEVLLSHMDRKVVQHMKPRNSLGTRGEGRGLRGCVPDARGESGVCLWVGGGWGGGG